MKRVAYFGDTSQPGPASYLQGIMTHYNIPFVYVPSEVKATDEVLATDIGLYIFSDYPSADFTDEIMGGVCLRIKNGAGALMFGGWESYHGLGGDYDKTPLADLLPVNMLDKDDRCNWGQLILVRKKSEHDILVGLPFDTPPGIGGYNLFSPKEGAKLLLEGERYCVSVKSGEPELSLDGNFPLLVVDEYEAGECGKGRRACLATDVAPHWVGSFVDWGNRLRVDLPDGDFIEVGSDYAEFFARLVKWCLE
jgi:uncharacterized membrane protein